MSRRTEAEFVAFVAANQPVLSRMAHLLTGNASTAEDLVQEALVRTYERWHKVDEGAELAYVRRVMANLNTDWWRRRRFESRFEAPEQASASFESDVLARDEIVRELARLTPKERTILVLRFHADLTERAVADDLGIPLGSVKSATHRALARLRNRQEPNAEPLWSPT